MTIVTAKTKARMLIAEGIPVVGAALSTNVLHLTRQNGSIIITPNVKGNSGLVGISNNIQRGTYTPSWTSVAPGTGGTMVNTVTYQVLDAGHALAEGVMNIGCQLRYGTTGATMFAALPRFTLPSGWTIRSNAPIVTTFVIGTALLIPQGVLANAVHALAVRVSDTTIGVQMLTASSTFIGFTSTTPFTWAAGDVVLINVQGLPVRRT